MPHVVLKNYVTVSKLCVETFYSLAASSLRIRKASLAGVSLSEGHPVHRKGAGLMPGQVTHRGCRFGSSSGHVPSLQVPPLLGEPTRGNQLMFLINQYNQCLSTSLRNRRLLVQFPLRTFIPGLQASPRLWAWNQCFSHTWMFPSLSSPFLPLPKNK